MRKLSDLEFDIKGFEELQSSLAKAVKKYPDLAEERLDETAKNFKKRVIKITKSATDVHTGKLIKGYRLGKVRGYGAYIEKDFRGTAPQFHLVENGHEQKNSKGEIIGFVPGRLIVKQARNEWEEELPKVMKSLLDNIIEASGL